MCAAVCYMARKPWICAQDYRPVSLTPEGPLCSTQIGTKNTKTVFAEYSVPVTNVIVFLLPNLVFMYLYVWLSIYVFAKTI